MSQQNCATTVIQDATSLVLDESLLSGPTNTRLRAIDTNTKTTPDRTNRVQIVENEPTNEWEELQVDGMT